MHIREVVKHTLADFEAGNTVIWKGPPGFGKTDKSMELYHRLVADNPTQKVGLCRVFMATQQDVDATGLPWKGSVEHNGKVYTITDPAMPRWFISSEGLPATCYDLVLLILEEWGQGGAEAKKAFASVMLEKGVPGFYLPEGSHILALTNVDAADGVTKEFDFVIGRRKEYTITADVKVWDEDFASKAYSYGGKTWQVSPLVRAWAINRPDAMFEAKPKVQGPWANPRSVCAADRYMQVLTRQNGGKVPLADGGFLAGMEGGIGMPATQSLMEFAEWQINLPQYEDVVKDPINTPVPKPADQLMLMAYGLAHRTQPQDLDACIQYVQRMPKDMSITYAQSLVRRVPAMVIEPAMTAWTAKNASLLAIMTALAKQ
jgi:hypothetical protein